MTGVTTYAAGSVLNWATGKAQMPTVTNSQVGLFLTVGADDGTGFTEVSGSSYARAITTPVFWGAPTGTKPVQISNARSIQFPVSASVWGTVLGFGLFDLSNNLLWQDFLGSFPWVPFTASIGILGVFVSPGHGFVQGDQVVITAEYGGQLPQATMSLAGVLTVGIGVTTDSFNLGVNVTVSGSGMLRKILPLTIGINQTPAFNPAALVLQLA